MAGSRPSLMRSLGAFVGHLTKAVKTDVTKPPAPAGDRQRHEIGRRHEEERRPGMILRRTTIDEVEFTTDESDPAAPPNPTAPASSDDTPDRPRGH